MPAGLRGCIIMAIVGKDLRWMFQGAKNERTFLSWYLVWNMGLWYLKVCPELATCLRMWLLHTGSLAGWARISADGFIWSRHRRIQFPKFLPTSTSLCRMLWWTLTATSKTLRVRLHKDKMIWKLLSSLKERKFVGQSHLISA